MVDKETARLAYKEEGDKIRHFSTVRSALTTFLLTVSLAAFSAFFTGTRSHPFLILAALVAMLAAVVACLCFSFRTEKSVIRYKEIWAQINGAKAMAANATVTLSTPSVGEIWKRMAKDLMNWLLLLAAIGLMVGYCLRDKLEAILQGIHLL